MSAMPVSVLKNFLHSLINALDGLPEQSEIRDILQQVTIGKNILFQELMPPINAIFVTHDCLHLSADEVLALRNFDQLEELHRKARRIKDIQSLKTEWEALIS